MEFTISRRVRRRGIGLLWAAGIGVAAVAGWLALRGTRGVTGPLFVMGVAALCAARGGWELRRAGKPFRLRVDDFGLTLHDAELGWEQIDAVALRYREGGEDSTPQKPQLAVWTAPGVKLPRRADRTYDGRARYTLLDTEDLDQGLGDLTAALAAHGGARFETAPRSVRTPTPVTVSGPENRVPGGEHVFQVRGHAGRWALLCAAAAVACTEPLAGLILGQRGPVPLEFLGPLFLPAFAAWWGTVRFLGRWRRPRQLTVGPGGIAAREAGGAEVHFGWGQIAAITVGSRADHVDARPWLIVWPLPGVELPSVQLQLVEGHRAHALIRLDRVPGGPAAVTPSLHAFAGERFGPTPR